MDDLREMMSAKELRYFDGSTHIIRYLSKSSDIDKVKVSIFKIPIVLRKHPFFIACVEFTKQPYFNDLEKSTQYHYVTTIKKLVVFAIDNPTKIDPNDIGLITPNYRYYLKELGHTYDRIRREVLLARKILVVVCDPVNKLLDRSWFRSSLMLMRDHTKLLRYIDSKKQKKSLKDLMPESSYTDEELLLSLRSVSIWFVNKMNKLREDIHEASPKLMHQFILIHGKGTTPRESKLLKYGGPESSVDARIMSSSYIKLALHLESTWLVEFLYYEKRRNLPDAIQSNAVSLSDMRLELRLSKTMLSDSHDPGIKEIYGNVSILKNTYYSVKQSRKVKASKFTCFSPFFLFSPSHAEQRALSWFLSSERIQPSSIENMKLTDIYKDNTSLVGGSARFIQLKWQKGRSKKYFASPIYKKGSPTFDAINSMLVIVNSMKENLNGSMRNNYLLQTSNEQLRRVTVNMSRTSILPLHLLGLKGSEVYKDCLAEVKNAKPFLDLWVKRVESFAKLKNQKRIYDYEYGKKRKQLNYNSKVLKSIITEKAFDVSLDSIAQSRAILEDSNLDDIRITSTLSAHTVNTHINIYTDRVDASKKSPMPKSNFGEAVGDEMIKMARKVAGFRSKVEVINPNELSKLLGLSYCISADSGNIQDLNTFLDKAEKKGYEIGILGEMSDSDTTFIIQNGLSAALIMSYIVHIDNNLSKLSLDNERRAKLIVLHQIYLQDLLNYFPQRLITEGKGILEQVQFPFPSLL